MKGIGKSLSAAALAGLLTACLGGNDAMAQGVPPGCVATGNPNGAAAGALLGGVAGALLGNAASGRRKAGGTILGGVAGAAAGAAIGGSTGGGVRCPDGYAYRAVPPPDAADYDGPPPREGEIWYGAPPRIHERIAFLRRRIDLMDRDGFLSPRERDGALRRLHDIALREASIRDRHDGVLPPEARERLEDDLNEVASHLRWQQFHSEHADD